MREAWWSASVLGVRCTAFGVRLACLRHATAIAPNCSLVVPNSYMWRIAGAAGTPPDVGLPDPGDGILAAHAHSGVSVSHT
jgi:hypothetical protein